MWPGAKSNRRHEAKTAQSKSDIEGEKAWDARLFYLRLIPSPTVCHLKLAQNWEVFRIPRNPHTWVGGAPRARASHTLAEIMPWE